MDPLRAYRVWVERENSKIIERSWLRKAHEESCVVWQHNFFPLGVEQRPAMPSQQHSLRRPPLQSVSIFSITNLTFLNFYSFKDESDATYQVTSINLFKTNIQPTWEDPKNARGGDFRIEVSNRDPTLLQSVWEKIAFGLVTGNIPSVEKNITGVCIV